MWLWEEYIIRHGFDINPADYGFETDPPVVFDSEISTIRVIRSEVTTENLWAFFIHHYNLRHLARREFIINNTNQSLTREQQLIFRYFPYLSPVWQSWQINVPDYF